MIIRTREYNYIILMAHSVNLLERTATNLMGDSEIHMDLPFQNLEKFIQPNNNQIQVISSDEKSISHFIGRSPDGEEENITQFPCHIVILDDLLYISDDSQIHVFQEDGKSVKSSWENPFPVSYFTIEASAISI
jgi:tRNA pseudouridine-54 N-methylase